MVKSNFDFEDIYAKRILAFEKEMARKHLRPPLPTQHEYMNTAPAAEKIRIEQKKARDKARKNIMKNIAEGEAVDSKTVATRLETSPQKVQNHLKTLAEDGYLLKLTAAENKNIHLYMKTKKKFKGDNK